MYSTRPRTTILLALTLTFCHTIWAQAPKPHSQVTWITERAFIESELLAKSEVKVQFKSSGPLNNVNVWLTPSLQGMTATPSSFATIEKDKTYDITLKLAAKPTRTTGGTLQLRDAGASHRGFASPLQILAKVQGDDNSSVTGTSTIAGIAASADYRANRVAAGQIVSIFGQGIGPDNPVGASLENRSQVATVASGVQVLFNGLPAPILMAVRDQINVVAPKGLASEKLTDVIVMFEAKMSQTVTVPVDDRAPALFSLDASGQGQAAAINQDGSINGASSRAHRGQAITLFGSGFGELDRDRPDGAVVDTDLPHPRATVLVTIGGVPAKVMYAGGAPGMVDGVIQINVEVPQGVQAGDNVEVTVQAGSDRNGRTVTISID